MKQNLLISGFADEISPDFTKQLQTVTELGMRYISLRSADGKNIAEYTPQQAREQLLPKLSQFGVRVSSIGSPIGKVDIGDEAGFEKQLAALENLCQICQLLQCRYIRIFSFFIPEGQDPERYREAVLEKMRRFVQVAERYGVMLLHENEKDIYGDTGARCKVILDALGGPNLRAAFDFANFVQCGEDTAVCWEMLKPYIEYIHIKDAVAATRENVPCGTGEGKIPQLLAQAIRDGYEGFLTLEPHLVRFVSLQSLEKQDAAEVIKADKAENGAQGYAIQYRALKEILDQIG
jgi:sugar phosphate isomerase/epimerase